MYCISYQDYSCVSVLVSKPYSSQLHTFPSPIKLQIILRNKGLTAICLTSMYYRNQLTSAMFTNLAISLLPFHVVYFSFILITTHYWDLKFFYLRLWLQLKIYLWGFLGALGAIIFIRQAEWIETRNLMEGILFTPLN